MIIHQGVCNNTLCVKTRHYVCSIIFLIAQEVLEKQFSAFEKKNHFKWQGAKVLRVRKRLTFKSIAVIAKEMMQQW